MSTLADVKIDIRKRVWQPLREVALPDSRHHYDFSSFIADFRGSSEATQRLMQLPCYKDCDTIFITPDNCLEELRMHALQDGKKILITTYGIRRGFWLLDPKIIAKEDYPIAALLDGMERKGRQINLQELKDEEWHIPLMVTGTGAINLEGVRFGKGHGFFDLEWGMLYQLGVVDQSTTVVGLVHDCQVLEEKLYPESFDTVCDVVVTPTRVVHVEGMEKPNIGIVWHLLQVNMLDDIPPLRELKTMTLNTDIH